jgi:hypothetical protein
MDSQRAASRWWDLVSAVAGARREGRQRADARAVAHEIDRSLDAVVGNVALIVTQLDPDSDAHARAWRALDEAKRVREVVRTWRRPETGAPRGPRSPVGIVSPRGRRRALRPAGSP